MEPREQQLVAQWTQMQDSAGAVEDADRQLWFSEAAAFLQSSEHWWCQHTTLTGHFAEIFMYHMQPVVQRLWDTVSQQLSTCALCVVNYHAAQVLDRSLKHTLVVFQAAISAARLQPIHICRRRFSSPMLTAVQKSCWGYCINLMLIGCMQHCIKPWQCNQVNTIKQMEVTIA